MPKPPDFSIAVLISGGGTTLKNLIEYSDTGRLDARVGLVVSSNPDANGLSFARKADIPVTVVQRNNHSTADSFCNAIFAPIRTAKIDLVVMGGFLKHVLIPDDFTNRVINIHPSLIPAYCGKGFYGARVHQAVLDDDAPESGCTVHFVDDQFDHGPIILQRNVRVGPEDTAQTLATRVFAEECLVYPEAINLIAAGRIHVAGGQVTIDDAV